MQLLSIPSTAVPPILHHTAALPFISDAEIRIASMMRESSVAATATNEMDLMPLYMSLIAGLSTCLGAVWVLFKKRPTGKASVDSVIHPSTMCFSLALAGSVMVTVSVVSIIPECLREQATIDDSTFHLIPLLSMKFFYRLSFHMIGYFLYFILSKFVFPEPNEILGLAPGQQHHEDVETQELIRTTSSDSSKDTAKARNRRLDSRPTGSLNVDEEEFEESSTGKDKEKVDFFRSLSRYSSGEDLQTSESKRAWRVAMLLFISLSVHNFPEGLAVAASAMNSPELGLKVTIGIMVLHSDVCATIARWSHICSHSSSLFTGSQYSRRCFHCGSLYCSET